MIRIVETPPLKLRLIRAKPRKLSPLEEVVVEQVSVIAWLYLMLLDEYDLKTI